MKKWNFKVKSSPKGVINKLDSALGSNKGFVFNIDYDKNDSAIFNIHKRVHYPDQILHRNRIIVNGKVLKTDVKNETNVEISFAQHFVMILTIYISFGLALFAIISGIISGVITYILGGILLTLGLVLWIAVRQKFESDIQKYKTFISEILESKKYRNVIRTKDET